MLNIACKAYNYRKSLDTLLSKRKVAKYDQRIKMYQNVRGLSSNILIR